MSLTPDPVVAPADTIRPMLQAGALDSGRFRPEWEAALAAVDEWVAVGERDRRQIARLREALSQLRNAVISENFSRPARSPAMSSNLRGALDTAALAVRETRPAGAVLAGEEDAGTALPIDAHELARRISGGAVERIAQFACGETGCMEIVEVPFDGSPITTPHCPVHATTMLLGGFRDDEEMARAAGEGDT